VTSLLQKLRRIEFSAYSEFFACGIINQKPLVVAFGIPVVQNWPMGAP
jgi:hypothetical protein